MLLNAEAKILITNCGVLISRIKHFNFKTGWTICFEGTVRKQAVRVHPHVRMNGVSGIAVQHVTLVKER
jgi:hypothetical protein